MLGNLIEPIDRNSQDVRNASLFQCEIQGGISVKKVSDWMFMIIFQREYEMHQVLFVSIRRVFGDLFGIKKWEQSDNLVSRDPTEKIFLTTIHNLTPSQVTNENLR